jgi:4-methyl-5(b-hydroxyethyl)-thiazole monophosphate biosynthesis
MMARVLVPLAAGCEELEAVTIIDLLRRAGVEVVSAGLEPGVVRASRGTQLVPDADLDSVLKDDFDMIALPGGMPGAQHLKEDPRVQALLKRMAGEKKYTAAICAAPIALAEAGLLSGRKATSYPGALERLGLTDINLQSAPVVRDGRVVTSRGPGTAMDFALELIEILVGENKRNEVEAGLVRS